MYSYQGMTRPFEHVSYLDVIVNDAFPLTIMLGDSNDRMFKTKNMHHTHI